MTREKLNLNAEDQRRLNELLDRRSTGTKRYFCLRTLVDDWRLLAGSLDTGYRLGFDSYANDISTRNLLQTVMEEMPQVAGSIAPTIKEADSRFLGGTIEDVRADVLLDAKPAEWWKKRLPQRADHRFWEQIESMTSPHPRD